MTVTGPNIIFGKDSWEGNEKEALDNYLRAVALKQRIGQIEDIESPLLTLFEPVGDQVSRVAHFYEALTFRGIFKDQTFSSFSTGMAASRRC